MYGKPHFAVLKSATQQNKNYCERPMKDDVHLQAAMAIFMICMICTAYDFMTLREEPDEYLPDIPRTQTAI